MIIECKNCNSRLKVDEKAIKPAGSKVRCSNCSHVFTVHRPDSAKQAPEKTAEDKKPSSSPTVFAVSNQKGGVAKTTTCLNLGVSFSLLKKRVLIIDFDVQANLTTCLGYKNPDSFYEAVQQPGTSLSRIIVKTRYPNLWLLPSNRNMVMFNKKYFGNNRFEHILADRLAEVNDQFDLVLIDTPPSMEFFTVNALTAANKVIIPSNCEFLATQGVNQTVNFIRIIRGRTNPSVDFNILVTMYDDRDTVSKLIHSKLRKMYPNNIFKSVISLDTKVRESQIMNMPVIYYYKHSRAGLEYVTLAREIIGKPNHGRG